MEAIEKLHPTEPQRVINLVAAAGVNVSDWSNFRGGSEKAAGSTTTVMAQEEYGRLLHRDQVGTKSGPGEEQVRVLEIASISPSLQELMEPFGRTNRTKFSDQIVAPLLEARLLEMTTNWWTDPEREMMKLETALNTHLVAAN